jgi:predicted transcriptional regulator
MEIIVAILTEAVSGAHKTRIMYRANLNFLRFNAYLAELLAHGLLRERNQADGRVVYEVTAAGQALLETLQRAQEFMAI